MNFFKGEFKIGESWDKQSPRNAQSREKSREKSRDKNKLFQNLGKNIVNDSIPDILDTQTAKYIIKEFNAEIPPSPMPSIRSEKKISVKDQNSMRLPPKQKNALVQGQNDLLTSMATRLKTVQIANKNLREQLKQKNQIIDKTKAENIFLKGFRQDAPKQYEKMKKINQENEELKKKVIEMENYLKQYGLKWVGNKMQGKLDQQNLKKAIHKGNYQYRLPKEIDINTITRRIQELNSGLHSEGMGTQIYQQNGIHKFRKAEPLPIGFFANGIAIKGYKFFSYKTKESLQVLGDLVDGYFPSVLKGKYPGGVFMKVVDKLSEQYNAEISQDNITSFQSKENNDFKPPTKAEFLSKLPKNIIKNGKVIPIRDAIQKRMNGDSQKQIKETPQQEQNEQYEKQDGITIFKTKERQLIEDNTIQEEEVCMLKIRNEGGDIFILKLGKDKKMKEVYFWMKKVMKKKFKIMSNYPRRSYEQDESQDLETLGFLPNAMLHVNITA